MTPKRYCVAALDHNGALGGFTWMTNNSKTVEKRIKAIQSSGRTAVVYVVREVYPPGKVKTGLICPCCEGIMIPQDKEAYGRCESCHASGGSPSTSG